MIVAFSGACMKMLMVMYTKLWAFFLIETISVVIWDRNKIVTFNAEWPEDLSTLWPCVPPCPARCTVTRMTSLDARFYKYHPNWARWRACAIEAFRKCVATEVLPWGRQPSAAQAQNRL